LKARLCSYCVMSSTAILRTRIDPRRKARVEKILDQLGMTSTQAVNMFFAQIERRKAIPFSVTIQGNGDVLPPIAHVAQVWGELDCEDFSHLDTR
jgi:addiction module RelB/DinJ family antitoxin